MKKPSFASHDQLIDNERRHSLNFINIANLRMVIFYVLANKHTPASIILTKMDYNMKSTCLLWSAVHFSFIFVREKAWSETPAVEATPRCSYHLPLFYSVF
jgi:hypothetical protein